MNAVAYRRFGTSDASVEVGSQELRGTARAIGVLYLVLASIAMFSVIVLETLAIHGDPAATADNILGSIQVFELSLVGWVGIVALDATIAVLFYVLLEPISRSLALVTSVLRLVYTVVLGGYLLNLFAAYSLLTSSTSPDAQVRAAAAIEEFSSGFLLALVFFGMHLIALGVAFLRSRYVPRVLGVLLVAAGAGYIVETFASFFISGYGGTASLILAMPAILAEFGLPIWLLVKGVSTRSRESNAVETSKAG